jgi:hypothetical protein
MGRHGADAGGNANVTLTAERSDMLADMEALKRRLAALEASIAGPVARKRSSRPTARTLAILASGAVLAGASIVYGQGLEALFVHQNGNVGIGTPTPASRLTVIGNASIGSADAGPPNGLFVQGNVGIGTAAPSSRLAVIGNASIGTADAAPPNGLLVQGNVGIGTKSPSSILDVAPSGGGAFYLRDSAGTAGTIKLMPSGGANYIQSGLSTDSSSAANLHFTDMNAQHTWMSIANTGNVGIGTSNPKAKLEVGGGILAATVNGEKPPYVFEIGTEYDIANWHAVQVPSDIIESYLGDVNGGTIKILWRVNSTGEVRVISETVYIEQQDKSQNKTPGVHGYTRQLGGGDSNFILGTATRYEVIPTPWQWMYVRNYPNLPSGQAGSAPAPIDRWPPWTGRDKYKLEFLTPPNVSATVIIYDR